MPHAAIPPRYLPPGMVVTAPLKNWVLARHFGIITPKLDADGMPVVIANSRGAGGPAEESWRKFTEGRGYENAYYPGELAPEQVLANAYALFGTRYHLLSWNCEHFVNACHGLPATSNQVMRVAFAAMVGGLALAAVRG